MGSTLTAEWKQARSGMQQVWTQEHEAADEQFRVPPIRSPDSAESSSGVGPAAGAERGDAAVQRPKLQILLVLAEFTGWSSGPRRAL